MIEDLLLKQKTTLEEYFQKIQLSQIERLARFCIDCKGKLIFIGMGKSGLIAKKLVATFISTGTKASFLSPTDALHGDLGMVEQEDRIVFLSKSGNTQELLELLPFLRNPKSLLHSNPQGKLTRLIDVDLYLPLKEELCPYDLAPTTSTALQLLVGDLLAIHLMKMKKVKLKDYAKNHPSGFIGKKVFSQVKDLMRKGEKIPFCKPDCLLLDVLPEISKKGCGCLLVTDENEKLLGIFTDGDLRRCLESKGIEALKKPLKDLMSKQIEQISDHTDLIEALKIMENPKKKITALPVVSSNRVVGLLHLHDIF